MKDIRKSKYSRGIYARKLLSAYDNIVCGHLDCEISRYKRVKKKQKPSKTKDEHTTLSIRSWIMSNKKGNHVQWFIYVHQIYQNNKEFVFQDCLLE